MSLVIKQSLIKRRLLTRFFATLALPLLLLSVVAPVTAQDAAQAAPALERVTNFTLLDQHGKAVELYYHGQAKAIVLLTHRNDSAVVKESAAALSALTSAYADQDVKVFLINPIAEQDRASVLSDSERQGIDFQILIDDTQLLSESLQLSWSGEAIVIDPRRWNAVYRGPVAEDLNKAADGKLATALNALVTGTELVADSQAMPAAWSSEQFTLPGLASQAMHSDISYSDTIAPMLKEKCASCHRPGGIGPWAMTDHRIIQGFSPMIKEVILTKRMPPWHADPEIGSFKHDMSLSTEEAQTLVHWIGAGAQRGTGDDPLKEVEAAESDWQLGTPDLIVDLPAFEVPATGTLDYQFFEVANPLDHDVWVRAVEITPGDRQVVHHAIATFGPSSDSGRRVESGEALFQSQLMTFVPGNETYVYPENVGLKIPAGSSFYTQMHYTTYGRETVDQSRIGLYFTDQEPEHILQHHSILNLNLRIPAGEAEHREGAYYQFQRDAVIYSLFPHAHYRGRNLEFALRYPDGREELVLSVPNYDFNWQRYFQFEEPINVPAGTMVIHHATYDNSTANPSNPNPEVSVRFGEQTWEEMLYGGISYRYAEPGENDSKIDPADAMASVAMGFMDSNMDGMIALDEMPAQARQSLAMAFVMMDKEKKGGLNFAQFRDLMSRSGGLGNMRP